MASVPSGSANHGFASVVLNRNRPKSSTISTKEIVVISDDDEDPQLVGDAMHQAGIPQSEATNPAALLATHYPHNSSMAQREPKRQKLKAFDDLVTNQNGTTHTSTMKLEYPTMNLNFYNDTLGNTKAHPTFAGASQALKFQNEVKAGIQEKSVVSGAPPVQVNPEKQPPYYDDPKLGIRMFCGPGFEHFPVPLMNDSKHQEFCDDWDTIRQRREERTRANSVRLNLFGSDLDHSLLVVDSDDDMKHSKRRPINAVEADCLAQIMDVLPDIEYEFAVDRLRLQHETYDFGDEEIQILPDASAIIAEILDMDNYPKRDPNSEILTDGFEDQLGKQITWDKSHQSRANYVKDAVNVLATQFEYVPTHFISKVIQEKKSLWGAYVHIDELDSGYFQLRKRPYTRSRMPRTVLEKKHQNHRDHDDIKYYANLVTELQAAKQHVARERLKKDLENQQQEVEKANLEHHRANRNTIECECCFDEDIPVNRVVYCLSLTNIHSFCYNCIENLANSQIGLMRHEMLCMHESGCTEKLDMDAVGKAIPIKTYDRLLLNEQQAAIAAANLEGLEQCPHCDFKAICDPVEVDTLFSCQNPDCFKVTCRICNETSHLPKTCEEVRKDRGLNARHKVEEARSAATMRPCPKCKTSLIKESGCNKLRCQCGTVICYVCKIDLSTLRDAYTHFHGRGGDSKCPLYDTPGVDRHVEEANSAETKAIQEVKAADSSVEEAALQIETGKPTVSRKPHFPISRDELEIHQRAWERQRARPFGRVHQAPALNLHPLLNPVPVLNPPPVVQQPVPVTVPPGFVAPQNALLNDQRAALHNIVPAPAQSQHDRLERWRQEVADNHERWRTELNRQQAQLNLLREQRAARHKKNINETSLDFMDLDDAKLDADLNQNLQEHQTLNTANRMQDFRAEMARRRSRVQTRHNAQLAQLAKRNEPLQAPNPAILKVKNAGSGQHQETPGSTPNTAEQPRKLVRDQPQAGTPWRSSFRPPTPPPPNTEAANQSRKKENKAPKIPRLAQPTRRHTMPATSGGKGARISRNNTLHDDLDHSEDDIADDG